MKIAIAAVATVIVLLTAYAQPGEKKTLIFTETLRGELEDRAATNAGFRTALFEHAHLSFTNYDSSDGEVVTVNHGEFRSADEAQRYFQWSLQRKAAQVIKQEDKADCDGKTVGRTAEFVLKSDDKKTEWELMWTEKVHLILVSAPTRECLEEFERQVKERTSCKP